MLLWLRIFVGTISKEYPQWIWDFESYPEFFWGSCPKMSLYFISVQWNWKFPLITVFLLFVRWPPDKALFCSSWCEQQECFGQLRPHLCVVRFWICHEATRSWISQIQWRHNYWGITLLLNVLFKGWVLSWEKLCFTASSIFSCTVSSLITQYCNFYNLKISGEFC